MPFFLICQEFQSFSFSAPKPLLVCTNLYLHRRFLFHSFLLLFECAVRIRVRLYKHYRLFSSLFIFVLLADCLTLSLLNASCERVCMCVSECVCLRKYYVSATLQIIIFSTIMVFRDLNVISAGFTLSAVHIQIHTIRARTMRLATYTFTFCLSVLVLCRLHAF